MAHNPHLYILLGSYSNKARYRTYEEKQPKKTLLFKNIPLPKEQETSIYIFRVWRKNQTNSEILLNKNNKCLFSYLYTYIYIYLYMWLYLVFFGTSHHTPLWAAKFCPLLGLGCFMSLHKIIFFKLLIITYGIL